MIDEQRTAAVVAVGDELLVGRFADQNSSAASQTSRQMSASCGSGSGGSKGKSMMLPWRGACSIGSMS